MVQRNFVAAITLAAALCAVLSPAIAYEDQARVTVGAGIFGFGVASDAKYIEGSLAYRFQNGLFGTDGIFRGFKPIVGVTAESAGSVFGYAGFAAPFVFGSENRWEVDAEGGLGAYHQGNSPLNLGGTFEFHVGLASSYALTDNGRLGLAVFHISNANLHRKNPGVNSILATWANSFNGL